MNAPIKIANVRDIVTNIPRLVGYFPENSLVFVPVSGKHAGALVRVDLPSRFARDGLENGNGNCASNTLETTPSESVTPADDAGADARQAFIAAVGEHILKLRDCTAVLLCAFTQVSARCAACGELSECLQRPDCCTLLPGERLIDEFETYFDAAGIRTVSAVVVTPTTWYDYWSVEQGPSSDATSAFDTARAVSFAQHASIPKASEEAIANVAELCEQQTASTMPSDDEVLCAWNLMVDGSAWISSTHQSTLLAIILVGLQRARLVDLVLANAAYGQDAADELGRVWDVLRDEIPERELRGIATARTEYDPIDLDRTERASDVLKQIISHSPPQLVQSPLATLAWIEWCRGASSLAHYYSTEALRTGDEPLASLVYELVNRGEVPGWVDGSSCLGPVRDADVDEVLR
ncbi:DUF4192 family protein [Gulosibacter bifidus]|uniref:DUF4192 family protein n=1 Tax=Gulosibacter bifidus TaxID=272239 RepID=A0ABW5RH09_9MICO|nr:DUF4192 family protein [Gulosibacter bifidus]